MMIRMLLILALLFSFEKLAGIFAFSPSSFRLNIRNVGINSACSANGCGSTKLHALSSKFYQRITKYLQSVRENAPKVPQLSENEIAIETIVRASDDRKANNIQVIDVRNISSTTDYVVIMEGTSRPQNDAIFDNIIVNIKEKLGWNESTDGRSGSGWIVIDYGSILVHIMLPKLREFYKLEKHWRKGNPVDISHIVKHRDYSTEEYLEDDTNESNKDPFWNDV